jgi:hypothetical protein
MRILRLEGDVRHLTITDPRLRAVQSAFPVFEVLWTGIGARFWKMMLFLYGVYTASVHVAEAVLPPSTA